MITKFGKPVDILKFKSFTVDQRISQANKTEKISTDLCGPDKSDNVSCCLVCNSPDRKTVAEIYGVPYAQCSFCSHVYATRSPKKEELDRFYAKSDYSDTYTDINLAKARAVEIASPKVDFIKEQYVSLFGREPRSVFDVGAGAGHFAYAAREKGMSSSGIEISESSCKFAKEIFGIDLLQKDIITVDKNELPTNIDVLSFIGVLEHVNNPQEFLAAAISKFNNPELMVVVEVPRWDCVSTAVQVFNSKSISRHLVPHSHVSIFSDKSLDKILSSNGFFSKAAWYFGMDAYELFSGLSVLCGCDITAILKNHINAVQVEIDKRKLSDEVFVCAVRK